MDDDPAERLDLLSRTTPCGVDIRIIVVAPGCEQIYDESDWRDALIEMEQGEIQLNLRSGGHCWFRSGDVFWLTGLPTLSLSNRGCEPAVLVVASRRDRLGP